MQVFKAYLKVLNRKKGQMIMYLCIFITVIFTLILPNMDTDEKKEFTSTAAKYAIVDEDNSTESEMLGKYLEKKHELIELKKYDEETIQDEIYNRNIDCLVKINKGFGENVKSGNTESSLEIITIPGSLKSKIFESAVNSYLSYANAFVKSGSSTEEAFKLAEETTEIKTETVLPDGKAAREHGKPYFFFNYLGWIIICIIILGVCPVLLVFSEEEIKKRIEISSFRFFKYNKELMTGVLFTGAIVCAVFTLISLITLGADMSDISGGLYICNMIVYTMVALSIAFLISKLVSNIEIINMISNLVGLGMAFLCGVFVPSEYLGDGVVKISKFLPAYWYTNVVLLIDKYDSTKMNSIIRGMGIELLFAFALLVIAMVIAGKKREA